MKLRLNVDVQYECMDLRAETKFKKCASDKISRTGVYGSWQVQGVSRMIKLGCKYDSPILV